ncbi:MAG: hypothetical protein K2L74_01305, partial [Muribaculaceae bacterium]|nr:hypothetical protein [Muribaculaceae bacterium]
MKKIALLLAVAISSVSLFAQNVNKNELKQLKAFLAQPAVEAATNADALKVTDKNNPATWEGVTVENGHITAIDWKDKKLSGVLDLSGFKALAKVDVSRNRLTGFTAKGDGALTELNASRNKLTEFSVESCPQLTKLAVNNNRLTDIDLSGLQVLKTLNLSNNYLVSLDLSNSATLVT